MIVQPHAAHGLESHESTEECADQRYKPAENWDGTGNDVGDQGDAGRAAEPGNPVARRVGGEMMRTTEKT